MSAAWHYRPRVEKNGATIAHVVKLLRQGASLSEIARSNGPSRDTLIRWSRDVPEIAEALEAWRNRSKAR